MVLLVLGEVVVVRLVHMVKVMMGKSKDLPVSFVFPLIENRKWKPTMATEMNISHINLAWK